METVLATLVANISGRVRRETRGGRSYMVAPATLLVSGVLAGSEGPIYYPQEEVDRNPDIWNHVPIVVYHPTANGLAVSARDPDILDKSGIGFIYRAKSDKGKTTAEAWFDEDHTRRVDMRVYDALQNGNPIELSTGLFAVKDKANEGAQHSGTSYKFIARNYRADHLAVLPDQIGACSNADGCGILVNGDTRSLWQKLGESLGILAPVLPAPVPSTLPVIPAAAPTISPATAPTPAAATTNNTAPGSTDGQTVGADVNKTQLVDWMIANCSCWQSQGDREVLNALSESKLQQMKTVAERSQRAEQVAAAARKGFGLADDAGADLVVNATEGMTPDVLKRVREQVAAEKKDKEKVTSNVADNVSRLIPEEREDLDFARQEKNRQKEGIIGRLVANVSDDAERVRKITLLRNKSLGQLQELLDFMPPPPAGPSGNGSGPQPLYTGAAAPATNGARSQADLDDYLPVPIMNWADEAKLLTK
jgi:hypothetical protein